MLIACISKWTMMMLMYFWLQMMITLVDGWVASDDGVFVMMDMSTVLCSNWIDGEKRLL